MAVPGSRGQGDGPLGSGFNESPNKYGGYHRTLYDRYSNNHISWDTDQDDDYMQDTGHEDRDGSLYNNWGYGGG